MPKSKYNTNLASEFYVLSMLHRLGADAMLTLGNKKAVDIVVENESGDTVTIDVKGLADKTAWPIDNVKFPKPNHLLLFVCYYNKIDDTSTHPVSWVIPSTQLACFEYRAPGGRRVVRLSTLEKQAPDFRGNWGQITGEANPD